jgi:hypothetical protein
MILEAAQLLCTTHRVLDGKSVISYSPRKKTRWHLNTDLEHVLYKATHINHPSSVWTRECYANYIWHYKLFCALCDEYTYRTGKVHKCDSLLRHILSTPPKNINKDMGQTPFAIAIADELNCKDYSDPVGSYRKYYKLKRKIMKKPMVWTKRKKPSWFL